jgi:flagellar motor switch/type III secretory pathway protein FliN
VRLARQRIAAVFDVDGLAAALGSVLAADVTITVNDVTPRSTPPSADRSVHVGTGDATLLLSIEPSAALASVLLARVLERPVKLVGADTPLDAPIRGALTALAVEVARRARGTSELVALGDAPSGHGLGLRATVLIDERPYGVSVWAGIGVGSAHGAGRTETLDDLGDTPISVPLVAAESTATGREIVDLAPGAVWMPGAGWFSRDVSGRLADARSTLRRAALTAPSSERGVAVGHSDDGKIVLLGTAIALARDTPDRTAPSDESNMGGQNEDLNQAVLDSPVVVRVEVGSLTLAAREWAAVRPGDVLETGLALAEPVVLRIAGREVARGELVSIDGELGVKIRELVAPGRTP